MPLAGPVVGSPDEVNANSVQLSNSNGNSNGFVTSTSSTIQPMHVENGGDNDGVAGTNGNVTGPMVELVSEAIDLELEEPNH